MSAALWVILKACSLITLGGGLSGVLVGVGMTESTIGTSLNIPPSSRAILDSHIRFLGAIEAGYGMMMWWASDDIGARRGPIAILAGVMLLAVAGRLLSAAKHGIGANWVYAATAVEFIVPVTIYLLNA